VELVPLKKGKHEDSKNTKTQEEIPEIKGVEDRQ
jgi:hypothetical protein